MTIIIFQLHLVLISALLKNFFLKNFLNILREVTKNKFFS